MGHGSKGATLIIDSSKAMFPEKDHNTLIVSHYYAIILSFGRNTKHNTTKIWHACLAKIKKTCTLSASNAKPSENVLTLTKITNSDQHQHMFYDPCITGLRHGSSCARLL